MKSFTPTNIFTGAGTLISGLAGIGSQYSNYQSQKQAYEAQADYQAQLIRQQVEQNYNSQLALRQEQAQRNEQIDRQKFAASVQATKAKSSAAASAAARGVSGVSVADAISTYNLQSDMFLEGLERERQLTAAATESNINAIGLNKYIPGQLEAPSKTSLYGGIGNVLADTFGLFDARKQIIGTEIGKLK